MGDARIKLWVGFGAYLMVGATGGQAASPLPDKAPEAAAVLSGIPARGHVPIAQSGDGAHGDHGVGQAAAATAGQGGEGGEGGEGGAFAGAAPEAVYAGQLALMKGHLRVGRELVDKGAWNDAVFHFHHPAEEIYEGIEAGLKQYKGRPFRRQLEKLAEVVEKKDKARFKREFDRTLAAIDAATGRLSSGRSPASLVRHRGGRRAAAHGGIGV